MARIVLPSNKGTMKKTAERRFAMKEIEQDVLRTAGDYFAESPSLEERVARIEARDRVEELLAHYARCVDAQDAQGVGVALTRKMRKAWALRLRKMGKCATPACLL